MRLYILGVMLLVFTGCTSLKVQVSTADPIKLKEIASKIDPYEKLAFKFKIGMNPMLHSDIILSKDDIMNKVTTYIDEELKEGHYDTITAVQAKLNFDKNYTAAVDTIVNRNSAIETKMFQKKYAEAVNGYLGLLPQFQKLISNLKTQPYLTNEIKDPIILQATTNLNDANAVFHNGRANLLGDEIVSYITKKENDKIWESTYNKTVSNTFFGNSDIAVVLNEMPNNYNNNYSIKGVRVDAAKLIQSSFDMMTQVINVAASVSGVLPTYKGDDNSFYPEQFDEVKTLPAKTTELSNKKALFEQMQKQLLLKILNENINKKSGDDLKKAISEIHDYWEANKTNLN